MTLSNYPVVCYAAGCTASAAYKIAARWSDGSTAELKTYSLACPDCVAKLLADAKSRRASCRLAPEETLDEPGVFDLSRGSRDKQLGRRPDLEI